MSNSFTEPQRMVDAMEGVLRKPVVRVPTYPALRLVAERKVRAVLIGFAFLGVVGGLGGILVAIHMLKAPQMVFVVDAAGNITTGPLERVGAGSPLFTAIATQATLQFFSRGPGGLDTPELAEGMFTPECYQRLIEDVQAELPEMESRDLRYRPEIRDYELSVPDEHGRQIIRVGGFFVANGSVDGLAIREKRDFRLTLALIPNPNFASRGMYPFVVSAFKKVIES